MGPQSHVSCLFFTIDSDPQHNLQDLIGITAGAHRGSSPPFGAHKSILFSSTVYVGAMFSEEEGCSAALVRDFIEHDRFDACSARKITSTHPCYARTIQRLFSINKQYVTDKWPCRALQISPNSLRHRPLFSN